MGMGTATTHTLIAAERLGLPMNCVRVHYGDSRFPGVVLAGGSQQTASIGAAVRAAHRKLLLELLNLGIGGGNFTRSLAREEGFVAYQSDERQRQSDKYRA